ncbi:unnamed protein product [Hyaloperonospora brassicae]|uniref:Photolyase/cryptochrome alpha/beta domain-containing protein n=1 Tax=Hyaloperonospora brassicae TaxID=162125 RepID=A0AAV0TWA7_HYABA|nr:unnamed protein product [Hyaloperonospora brassicae]
MRVLLWFRRDLRLHDNLALHKALALLNAPPKTQSTAAVGFLPLYIVRRPQVMRCGATRFQFMLESVSDLSEAVEARGARLLVATGDSVEVLRRLLPAWGVTHLCFDARVEPFAVARDRLVLSLAKRLGVQTHVTNGYNLYDLDAVLAANGGAAPKTYRAFRNAVASQPSPSLPLEAPATLPAPKRTRRELYGQVEEYWQSHTRDQDTKEQDEPMAPLDSIAGPEREFTLPDAKAFGYTLPEKHSFLYGGERNARKILETYCREEGRVATFEKPKTSPAQISPSPSTSTLSPYLVFGCLSPRTFYHQVRLIQKKHKKASAPPVSLDGQLLWREFYHCHGHANPYFDKMEESSTCLQINWRWHSIPETEDDMTDDDKLARTHFEAWKNGQTGFPWIDAIMIQLKEEGWIHHLARHSVACFLTRGDLYISWVRGLEVFQEELIDHDWSLNAGNWLWLSSSYFFTAYFRVYSPISFGKKYDPEGLYIKKYIPALRKLPAKYIYEPWKAPQSVQDTSGCRIGKDYPAPIVNHKTAMDRCLDGMKRSFANKQYGSPPPSSRKRQREESAN